MLTSFDAVRRRKPRQGAGELISVSLIANAKDFLPIIDYAIIMVFNRKVCYLFHR